MREYFESLEEANLAPYSLKSKNSKGRRYNESPDEYRTCFQRDRDRIIHSRAFRRLKQKTQVFGVFAGDHYRTRLTHSLEVSQISRQIGRMLRLNEDVVESVALAHDLGHTPFGHVGEDMLNQLLENSGGFEHNRQSRRILEWLEIRYPSFPGLNISREILDGLIKHKTPYDNLAEENNTALPSLESQVVNVADEIAYNNHDLDDGITAGLLKLEALEREVALWKEVSDINRGKYVGISLKELHRLNISTLIGLQVLDVYKTTLSNLNKAGIETLADITSGVVVFSREMMEKNDILRKYLFANFYKDPKVENMNRKGAEIIKGLFDIYTLAPELLPAETSKALKAPLPRKIADYIASMTDNFATETLREREKIHATG